MRKLPTIRSSQSVREALQVIDQGAAEIALVVDEKNVLHGTLSDGDIRRALLAGQGLDSPIALAVNTSFIFVKPQASRSEVLDLMRAHSLSQIPVVDSGGKLVGLHLLKDILGARPRPNWAVIMAGGRGERLRPLTDSIPKPMIKVAGRPILERIVLHLIGFGIRRIFLAVHYRADAIVDHFGDGSQLGCQIDYLREDKPLGTGGALALLPEPPVDPLVVLNGDLVTQFDLSAMLRAHRQRNTLATIAVHNHSYKVPFGVIEHEEGYAHRLSEKPTYTWLVNAGIYVLDPALLMRIPSGRPFSMTGLIESCLDNREPVAIHQLDDWLDIGLPRQLNMARGES